MTYKKQPRDMKGRFTSVNNSKFDIDMGFEQDNDFTELASLCASMIKNLHEKPTIPLVSSVEVKGLEVEGFGMVYAGPYSMKLPGMKGIKLATELQGYADYVMDVKDFGIPTVEEMTEAILMGLKFLQDDGVFYVGCFMGQGRTGTYLSCLLKALGYTGNSEATNPLKMVRALYNPMAVETSSQEDFVEAFPVEKFEYLVRFLAK